MPNGLKYILGLLGLALLFFGLWYIRTIIGYILVSAILSLIAQPLNRFLNKLKIGKISIPKSISAAISLFTLIALFFGVISLFAPLVASQARAISNINVDLVIQNLKGPINVMEQWMNQYNLTTENTSDLIRSKLNEILDISDVTGIFSSLLGTLGNVFIAFFSICFISYFFIKEENLFYNILISFSPSKYTQQFEKVMSNTNKLLTRYFIGILGQVSLIIILISVGLSIVGVKNAIIIGLFAGIINVIPYIDPIIGALVGLILSVTTNLDLDFSNEIVPLLIKVVSVFGLVQLLDNFVFQPFIFSNSVNAHPLEIFIVILIAGTVAGISGMILAIPIYTLMRIVAKEFLSQFKIVQSLTKNL